MGVSHRFRSLFPHACHHQLCGVHVQHLHIIFPSIQCPIHCGASSTSPSWHFTARRLDGPTIIPGCHHHHSKIPLQVSFSTQEWLVEHRLVLGEGVESHGGWVLVASRLVWSD